MALYHSAKGPNNYTIIGSPTIVNGIVTSADGNNLFRFTQGITMVGNEVEMVFKYNISAQLMRGRDGSTNLFSMQTTSGGALALYTNGDVAGTILGATTHTYARFHKTASGDVTTISLSNDGMNWDTNKSFSNLQFSNAGSLDIALYVNQTSYPGAYVDLNKSYIKVNGQAWFGVCPVEVKHINYGTTVGYDKVGSPTISNGVVSGFSASDYIKTSSIPTGKVSDYEFNTKVTFGAMSGGRRYIISYQTNNYLCGLQIDGDNRLIWMPCRWANGSWLSITSPIQPSNGDTLLINCSSVGNGTFKLKVSNDNGTTWSEATDTLPEGVTEPTISSGIRFGRSEGTGNAYVFSGSIDLNYTKFKKNGGLWFYKPCTNYLVKDGKLIFADSGLYIDDNGTKTYASANIAPVPAGYTYGMTTTPAIGYVDMRTQSFTAAPEGATLGKDE